MSRPSTDEEGKSKINALLNFGFLFGIINGLICVCVNMSWLGQIRTHRKDEVWSASLLKTFFDMTMDTQIPVIPENPLVVCGEFQIDVLGDHLCTCTTHSGAKKAHGTGWLTNSLTFFAQHTK